MKVLYYTEYLHPQKNGIATRCETYIRTLRKLGHEVVVCGPSNAESTDIKLFTVSNAFYNKENKFIFPTPRVFYELAFGNYDALHIFYPPAFFSFLLLFFAWMLGIPIIASNHVNMSQYADVFLKKFHWSLRKLAYWIVKYSIYGPQLLFVKKENILAPSLPCEDFAILFNFTPKLIPSAVNTDLFQPKDLPSAHLKKTLISPTASPLSRSFSHSPSLIRNTQSPLSEIRSSSPSIQYSDDEIDHVTSSNPSSNIRRVDILYVGRLTDEKNISRLLELFYSSRNHFAKNYDLKLRLVGASTPEFMAKYQEYILSHDFQNSVEWCGEISHEKLVPYYQSANIFLTCSLSETFGFTLLEALACGTPILYPKCITFNHLYSEDFGGYSFDINQNNEFFTALENVLDDLQTAPKGTIFRCRDFVVKNFSSESAVRYLADIYRGKPMKSKFSQMH